MNNLEYHRDELLYFSLGQHPATGYNSVPPMIGLLAWVMQNIFGFSLFAVRLLPALASGAMIILVSAIARELGGGSYSRILAALGFLIAGFGLRTFSMFMPVFIDVLFWTIIFYLVIKYLNTASGKFLILLGIVAGFSLLNKYLIGTLFLSLLIVIPFGRNRHILSDRNFWLGIAGGALIFLPNILWQISHGLPVLNHLSELERTQLVYVDRLAFLGDQLMMPAFASFLTIAGLIFLITDRDVRKFRFLGIVSIVVIAILLFLRGKSYYTIGLFPFLIAAGAVSYEKGKLWLKVTLPVLLILLHYPYTSYGICRFIRPRGLLTISELLEQKYGIDIGRRFEDGSIHSLPQDYADMLGWEELDQSCCKSLRDD